MTLINDSAALLLGEIIDAGQFWALTGFQVVFDFCVIQIEEAT